MIFTSFNGRRLKSISRILIAAASLATAIAIGAPGTHPHTASAAVGPCRSDPVVVLSNLKTMDLSAIIQDSPLDLHGVTYTMQLPAGVKPLLVIATDGLVGQIEHFSAISNQAPGRYVITTNVSTGAKVAVTATVTGILAQSGKASGVSNQDIVIKF